MSQASALIPAVTAPEVIKIEFKGEPFGQPRVRMATRLIWKGKTPMAVGRLHTPECPELEAYKLRLAMALRPFRRLWRGPVRVDCLWYFERPQYLLKPKVFDGPIPHTVKPDRDNLDKATLDTICGERVFGDDAQVYGGGLFKYWVARGSPAGTRVTITLEQPLPGVPWKSESTRKV